MPVDEDFYEDDEPIEKIQAILQRAPHFVTKRPSLDDLTDRWHDSGGAPHGHQVRLQDYLGMTDEQYSEWARTGRDPNAAWHS